MNTKKISSTHKLFIRFLKENNCYHSFMYCFIHRREKPFSKYMYTLIDKEYTFTEYICNLYSRDYDESHIMLKAFSWEGSYLFMHMSEKESFDYWRNLNILWNKYFIQNEI